MKFGLAVLVLLTIEGFGSKYRLEEGGKPYWLVPKSAVNNVWPALVYAVGEKLELGLTFVLVG